MLKLRNEGFGIQKEVEGKRKIKYFKVGKIQKVKFPIVYFQIVNDDPLFNLNALASVPFYGNLKGDQDRIKKLKETLDFIYSKKGKYDLKPEPKIKEIIKDSSVAVGRSDLLESDEYNKLKQKVKDNLLGKRVNDTQLEGITKSLFAEDMFIIQGPPGTGKSTSISEIVWQHILKAPQNSAYRVLITSETNLAVDNALDKLRSPYHNLIKPIRFGKASSLASEGRRFCVDNIGVWGNDSEMVQYSFKMGEEIEFENNVIQDWLNRIARQAGHYESKKEYEPFINKWKSLLENPNKKAKDVFYKHYKKNVNVVGATCSTIGEHSSTGKETSFYKNYCKLFSYGLKFDLCIQDEASKAIPPEMGIPMVVSDKNIIIGDHRQLPPMVDVNEFIDDIKMVAEKNGDKQKIREARQIVRNIKRNRDLFEESHFEKLYRNIHDSLKTSLDTQYRMHSSINEAIEQFYVNDNGLKCGLNYEASNDSNLANPESRYHGIDIPNFISPEHHIIWVNEQSPEIKKNTSRYNMGEVHTIDKILKLLSENEAFQTLQSSFNKEERQIGIISFYGAQLSKLADLQSKHNGLNLRISTVDRFQGMERNVIIVSTVRSNRIATYEGEEFDNCLEQNSLGFAESPNRLNVALSRAKRLLIVVGNADHFTSEGHGEKSVIYKKVVDVIKNPENSHGLFIESKEI